MAGFDVSQCSIDVEDGAWSCRAVSPLHLAVCLNRPSIVQLLLDGGADPNSLCGSMVRLAPPETAGAEADELTGASALHVAVALGHAELIMPLIAGGATIDHPATGVRLRQRDLVLSTVSAAELAHSLQDAAVLGALGLSR
eukprot:TRINITY_DN24252_c0_g1_i1.p1 TRINITY_DN24252_c0_g1~~TRINITY_DN24252_c0_g1_i1.p1  ORF type:complete len:141 (+),score=35.72 TRINITY_DN24252_c0_g1_i1:102-524(+)